MPWHPHWGSDGRADGPGGEGVIEPDGDDTVTGEREEVIRRYRPDVQVERLIRCE